MIIQSLPRHPLRVLALCLLFLFTPASVFGSPATQAQTVLVLGDSISAAYGMSLEQGWVALLDKRLAEQGVSATVVNASISGETSGGGLSRLPALLKSYPPSLVVIELGANDGLRGFPLTTLKQNLQQMVSQSMAAGARVLLLPMEIPPNYGQRYTAAFRGTFAQVAEETGAALAPFILDGFATDPTYKQADGIHPTAAAQALMLENVYEAVLEQLGEIE